jgi:hypothetical protein
MGMSGMVTCSFGMFRMIPPLGASGGKGGVAGKGGGGAAQICQPVRWTETSLDQVMMSPAAIATPRGPLVPE